MDLNEYFKSRRTVRRYSNKELSAELLNEMLEAAGRAPNTGNMQLYSAIVTRTAEGKRELAPLHFGQGQVENCAAVITFCADFNRVERWCEVGNADAGFDNIQALTWGLIDATIFAQQFCVIAEMNGLGTCYLGTTTYNAKGIAKALNLPSRVIPVVTLTVGWPAGDDEQTDRLPARAIIHEERYRDFSEADIRDIYREKEQLEESRHFVEENGKDSLAQVYAEVRYPRNTNESFSREFLDFVIEQGFALPG